MITILLLQLKNENDWQNLVLIVFFPLLLDDTIYPYAAKATPSASATSGP